MAAPDKKWWTLAGRARNKLAQLVANDPAVSMVDIGMDDSEQSQLPVLRVHVKPGAQPAVKLPDNIYGIQVRTISGNYQLES